LRKKKYLLDLHPFTSQVQNRCTIMNAVYAVKHCTLPAYHADTCIAYLYISRFQIAKLKSGVASVIERYRYDPFRNRLISMIYPNELHRITYQSHVITMIRKYSKL